MDETGPVRSLIFQIQVTAEPVLLEESVALTWNWWVVSSERLVYVLGLEQLCQSPVSILHWKVTSFSLAVKLKVALRESLGLEGPPVIFATQYQSKLVPWKR